MKKVPAYIALIITGLLLTAPLSLAQTQTSTQQQPPPATTTATYTREPAPLTATQETQETSGEDGSQGSQGAATTTTTSGTATTVLPEPELPVIDLSTQETQEQCPAAATPEMCLDPQTARSSILPPVVSNQMKISVLVILAAMLGTAFWVVNNFILNAAHARRDAIRFARQDRLATEERRLENLRGSFNELADSLAGLYGHGDKMTLDKQALAAYKKASAGIELFGSRDTLTANGKLMDLVSGQKAPSAKEYEAARSNLISALKKDLGI